MEMAAGHGDLTESIARISGQIQQTPTSELYFQRGKLRLENGNAMAALADFDRIPHDTIETAPLRAEALIKLGKHTLALKTLDRFLTTHPDASRCLVLRARTFAHLGDPASAIRDYQKALALTPKPEPDLVLEVSSALAKQNRFSEALQILDHSTPKPLPSLALAALDLETRAGDWNSALRRIETMRKSAARPEPWMARRASILAQAGRIDESRRAWNDLLQHIAKLPPAERDSHAMSLRASEAREALASLTNSAPIAQTTSCSTESTPSGTTTLILQSPAPIDPPAAALTRGPYLQLATPTSMIVRWRTDIAVTGRVNIGPTPASVSQSFDESISTTEHSVKLTGLTPDTTYFYSAGTANGILAGGDAEHTFTTPPVSGTAKNTRIWVLGDAGTNNINQRNVRDAFHTFTGSRVPDLCLLLGDNAYNSGLDTEYQAAVFNIYPTLLRKTPFWSCVGNHDTGQSTAFVDTFPYFDIFDFPKNGEAGGVPSGTEHYYSFDHGNIHFISLDSMTASRAPNGTMATWLADDLASTTATWIIAFFHHPPYTKGSHNSDAETELIEMRQNILPILESGGVDLVLNGHSHCYERSFLLDGHYGSSSTLTPAMKKNAGDGKPAGDGAYIKPLTGPRDHFGAVYTVAGSAGQATFGTMNHPAMCFSVLELGSVILDINGTRLDSTFLRDNGTIRDSYTILKQGEADSDADGMPDTYELAHGLDRNDPADAALDSDGDGTGNLTEYAFGRPASSPDVYTFTTTRNNEAGTATVTFPTVSGRTYRVWWSGTLLANDWHAGSPEIPGTGTDISWSDPAATGPCRFYRIEAQTTP